MRFFYTLSLMMTLVLSSQAADFACSFGGGNALYLGGLESSPASLSSIALTDNTLPKDAVITGVSEMPDYVSIDFVNLETVSAFTFHVTKADIEAGQFTVNLFELGSPGSSSQNHILNCVKQ